VRYTGILDKEKLVGKKKKKNLMGVFYGMEYWMMG